MRLLLGVVKTMIKALFLIISVAVLLQPISNTYAFTYGDPTPAEQAHLEVINRARADPLLEAARLGLSSVFEGTLPGDISGVPMPPLVLNGDLSAAALGHSQDMAVRDYFAHNTPDGVTPWTRIDNAGYNYSFAGENLAAVFSTVSLDEVTSSLDMHDNLFRDDNYPDRGHRVNILSGNFREIGIGIALGFSRQQVGFDANAYYVTTDFGTSLTDDRAFVLGVVYDDTNSDGVYTAGEGAANVAVDVLETGDVTNTASAGGYAFPLQPGTYTVNFMAADGTQVSRQITLGTDNVKLDVTVSELIPLAVLVSPALTINISGVHLSITRNSIDGASRYVFYYAPANSLGTPDVTAISSLEMQDLTISGDLWSGAHYFAVLEVVGGSGVRYSAIYEVQIP